MRLRTHEIEVWRITEEGEIGRISADTLLRSRKLKRNI